MSKEAPFGKRSCHRTVTEELYQLTERQRDSFPCSKMMSLMGAFVML